MTAGRGRGRKLENVETTSSGRSEVEKCWKSDYDRHSVMYLNAACI